MDILQNPFHILNASTRDKRQRIIELAEARSLLIDSSECTQARSDLTIPRKRLSAEISWLPGVSPTNSEKVVRWLSTPIQSLPQSLTSNSLSPLARANILASGLQRLADHNADNLIQWTRELARAFELIEAAELCTLINEERIVSGFPAVKDLSMVEREIKERRRHYREVIKSSLNNLSTRELVEAITALVESETNNGERHGPVLINDLVELFEVEAQSFFEKEMRNIELLVEELRTAADTDQPDSILAPIVSQLIKVVKNWDIVAQPIQVSTKSLGLDHEVSHQVAGLVREVAIHIMNEHGKLDFSQQLTTMLQDVFDEVGEIAERLAEDISVLDDIAEQRVRLIEDAKNQSEEWRKEISYEASVGVLIKDKLRISPEGIEWKGRKWDLDNITWVRWGGTRHSLNGIPTGTSYNIVFGNSTDHSSIELRKQDIYNNFVDRLWRAVGTRLMIEFLEGLRDGMKFWFGATMIEDRGIELERKKLFSRNERVFCQWGEMVIWNGPGVFCMGKKDEKKLAAAFSYQDDNNIHVLEAAIRAFWKRAGDRLSSLLETQ